MRGKWQYISRKFFVHPSTSLYNQNTTKSETSVMTNVTILREKSGFKGKIGQQGQMIAPNKIALLGTDR